MFILYIYIFICSSQSAQKILQLAKEHNHALYWYNQPKQQKTTFSKEHKHMPKQHQSGKMRDVMKELKRLGFQIQRNKNGSFKIIPPTTIQGPVYVTHATESAYHPMRRDFKKMYNVNIIT
jgi:hypothetical protein